MPDSAPMVEKQLRPRARGHGGSGNFTGSRTKTFFITGKVLTDENATVSAIDSVTYSGTAKTPKPTVTLNEGNRELIEGTDYELSYANNTNAGTATVIITGKGDFAGTATVTAKGKGTYEGTAMSAQFTISPAAITEVSVAGDTTYGGTAKTPEPTVEAGEKTLAKDTDYTIEYRNNVSAGTANVVTGKGNYGGTRGATFSIAGASIEGATIDGIAEQTYTGKDIKPEVVVKLADKTLVEGTVGGDKLSYTVTRAAGEKQGTYAITPRAARSRATTTSPTRPAHSPSRPRRRPPPLTWPTVPTSRPSVGRASCATAP